MTQLKPLSPPVDLRSDTVTKPTPEMRVAMANAVVGDDVLEVDPTVARLQARVAEMLGKEDAIYMPSGSMTNQVGIRLHCQPGDEFLCEEGCHVFNYEQGAFAQLSGLVARTVRGEDGILRLEQLEGLIRGSDDHLLRTRLLCLENTHNRGAGRVQPYEEVSRICRWAHEHGLRTHLDGARLFNAAVASGIDVATWAEHFDSVSVCFSKGLGAPVGSALAGPKEFIRPARRARKLFGGGMRQVGIIAAGALYALENNIQRLAEDHQSAQVIAAAVRECDGLTLVPEEVDTNIVIFRVDHALGTAAEFVETLEAHGVRTLSVGRDLVRVVTHLDAPLQRVEKAADILRRVAERASERSATHVG